MKCEKIYIPKAAEEILKTLNENGFEAYIVGGYVRDAVLGRECGDIDITTDAVPEDVIRIFKDHYISKTGLIHGTVGVVYKGESYEITTYRIDGEYKDHRHPEDVRYSKNITEDLSRRDFTVNTLFYGLKDGVGDKCGGLEDLEKKLIRTVGDPVKRFTEDGLRILRGLRFASQLGFRIDEDTLIGMIKTKSFLRNISAERIASDFLKIVCAPFFYETAEKYTDTFSEIFSEIFLRTDIDLSTFGFPEKVILKSAECAQKVPRKISLKLSAFLTCFDNEYLRKNTGADHGDMTKKFLTGLKCSGKIINDTCFLVNQHCTYVSDDKKCIASFIRRSSSEMLLDLFALQKALGEICRMNEDDIERSEIKANKLLSSGECLVPRELNINGKDIMALGCKDGKKIGYILEELYMLVIEDKIPNDKKALEKYALFILEN